MLKCGAGLQAVLNTNLNGAQIFKRWHHHPLPGVGVFGQPALHETCQSINAAPLLVFTYFLSGLP